MNKLLRFSLVPVVALMMNWAASSHAQVKAVKSNKDLIDRGRYIVEDQVMCEQCHTPRNPDGTPDREHWLMGGPTQLRPTYSSPDWAVICPRIAGTPPGTDEEIIRLLTTGIARTGRPPRPPMLQFHMTREDAQAVLAYLKSLPH
jgi:mono/diheme cytochrome c family protein